MKTGRMLTLVFLVFLGSSVQLTHSCRPDPGYDMFFHDQNGGSELRLNRTTGDYLYSILSGPHAGESFTGVTTIVNYGPTYFLFKSACRYGSPCCLMGNWDASRLKASASLRVNSPSRYYSNLYDPDYTDSAECGTPVR